MVTQFDRAGNTAREAALETRVFRALADPSRRQILDRLLASDASVNELAEGFETSRPAVSRHLRVLRDATLVVERREGRRRVYSLNPQPMARADAWLTKYRAFWAARLHALKLLAESEASRSALEEPSRPTDDQEDPP